MKGETSARTRNQLTNFYTCPTNSRRKGPKIKGGGKTPQRRYKADRRIGCEQTLTKKRQNGKTVEKEKKRRRIAQNESVVRGSSKTRF